MSSSLTIGIDASNLRFGGGLTHLSQLLCSTDPGAFGIGRVVVWGGGHTLEKLPDYPWLAKLQPKALDKALPVRLIWQQFALPRQLRAEGCDVLFSPGGVLPSRLSIPSVAMSQNMLPFQPEEAARFGRGSRMWWKMILLRRAQSRSLRQATGLIFLTEFARRRVLAAIGRKESDTQLVPHGLEERFFEAPREALPFEAFSDARPFRVLYVSIVDAFKHQWQLVRAVGLLRQEGLPISLELIGSANPAVLPKLIAAMDEVDPARRFVCYRGLVPFEELHASYHNADAFAFASSCENLPNILLEAMAAGLPIASSSYGPMPEVMGNSAMFFDPLDVGAIAAAIRQLAIDQEGRRRLAAEVYSKAKLYSWEKCARDTFSFLVHTVQLRQVNSLASSTTVPPHREA